MRRGGKAPTVACGDTFPARGEGTPERAESSVAPLHAGEVAAKRPVGVMYAALALTLLSAPLAACGFTPLYAENGLSPALSSVAVVTPDHSRFGYLLREQLDDTLGRDRDTAPAYRLVTTLTDYRVPLGVRVNNVASRYEIGLTVAWKLVNAATGATLTAGSSVGRVSYASSDAPYGGVAAEQDGEQRAADQAAIAIRLALSRWFKQHPPAG